MVNFMSTLDGIYQRRIGSKIRRIRKEKAMTLEQVANLCDCTPEYIRHIETGIKVPSLPLMILLCRTLDTSPNYILDFYVEENEEKKAILDNICQLTLEEQELMFDIVDLYVSRKERL